MQLQTNVNMPHPTPPNPMSNVACTSDATSYQRQHAHPTTPPQPTPPRPLSTHVGRSKNRYNKPPSPAKVQPSVVEPKLPLWESDVAKARVDNIAMGSLTEALAKTTRNMSVREPLCRRNAWDLLPVLPLPAVKPWGAKRIVRCPNVSRVSLPSLHYTCIHICTYSLVPALGTAQTWIRLVKLVNSVTKFSRGIDKFH